MNAGSKKSQTLRETTREVEWFRAAKYELEKVHLVAPIPVDVRFGNLDAPQRKSKQPEMARWQAPTAFSSRAAAGHGAERRWADHLRLGPRLPLRDRVSRAFAVATGVRQVGILRWRPWSVRSSYAWLALRSSTSNSFSAASISFSALLRLFPNSLPLRTARVSVRADRAVSALGEPRSPPSRNGLVHGRRDWDPENCASNCAVARSRRNSARSRTLAKTWCG